MAIGKVNPEEICTICGEKIFNRMKSSLYCLECMPSIRFIQQSLQNKLWFLRKEFKKFKINLKITVKKK